MTNWDEDEAGGGYDSVLMIPESPERQNVHHGVSVSSPEARRNIYMRMETDPVTPSIIILRVGTDPETENVILLRITPVPERENFIVLRAETHPETENVIFLRDRAESEADNAAELIHDADPETESVLDVIPDADPEIESGLDLIPEADPERENVSDESDADSVVGIDGSSSDDDPIWEDHARVQGDAGPGMNMNDHDHESSDEDYPGGPMQVVIEIHINADEHVVAEENEENAHDDDQLGPFGHDGGLYDHPSDSSSDEEEDMGPPELEVEFVEDSALESSSAGSSSSDDDHVLFEEFREGYHNEGQDPMLINFLNHLYSTLKIYKHHPQFLPYPQCWFVGGYCAPIRQSISFLCGKDPAQITVYLGKDMSQKVNLEPGMNIFSWDICKTPIDIGGHMAPSPDPRKKTNHCPLSFGSDGEHKWETRHDYLRRLPRGVADSEGMIETWISTHPPRKTVVVTPIGQVATLSSLCRSMMNDNAISYLCRLRSISYKREFLRTTFYDVYTYKRFVHPIDAERPLELPTLRRRLFF